MATALARAKRKPVPSPAAPPEPMSRDEAEDAITSMSGAASTLAKLVLQFSDRRGWAVLGFTSCRQCLIARLNVTLPHLSYIMRAERARQETAAVAGTAEERRLVEQANTAQMHLLAVVEDPAMRLRALRETHNGSARAGKKVTAGMLGQALRRLGVTLPTRKKWAPLPPERTKCSVCDGRGWLVPSDTWRPPAEE